MPPDDDTSHVIPNRSQRRSSVGFIAFAALDAWILFRDHTSAGYLFFAAAAFCFLVLAVRSWNSRIEIDSEGLTSHNDLRTRKLKWSDVSAFEHRGALRGLGAIRNDGKFVRLQGYPVDRTTDAREIAVRLETERVLSRTRKGHTP